MGFDPDIYFPRVPEIEIDFHLERARTGLKRKQYWLGALILVEGYLLYKGLPQIAIVLLLILTLFFVMLGAQAIGYWFVETIKELREFRIYLLRKADRLRRIEAKLDSDRLRHIEAQLDSLVAMVEFLGEQSFPNFHETVERFKTAPNAELRKEVLKEFMRERGDR